MKVLFFTHYYTPEGNAPASRVSALCERWVKAGHEVTVIVGAPSVPRGIVYDGYKNERTTQTINGVKVERIKTYIAANKGAFRRMLNFASYFFSALKTALSLPKPDIVIATSPQIFCGYVGVWYKRFRHVPFILEIRDIWPESMEAVGAKIPSLAYLALEHIESSMYKHCNHLVTVGDGYLERLIEKGLKKENISIIMNGTDLSIFYPRPKNEALLARHNLIGKYVVSYIGTVGMACGLEVVLECAKNLPKEIAFLIVGDGAELENLRNSATENGLNNVVFTGRVEKRDIPDYIASSDASLVHLRKTELFTTVMPSKIFESAGMKRPIIMGVDGHAKKLVLDAQAGIDMRPSDATSLRCAILKLYQTAGLSQTLGENAYRNIALVHNRDTQAENYLKIITKVLA